MVTPFPPLSHRLRGSRRQISFLAMPRQPATHHLPRHHCGHCGQGFPTPAGVQCHIGHSPHCQAAALRRTAGRQQTVNVHSNSRQEDVDLPDGEGWIELDGPDDSPDGPGRAGQGTPEPPQPEPQRYAYKYDQGPAAEVLGSGPTVFETMKGVQEAVGQGKYSPFADREEWELADWLVKNVNQRATDEFLKLSIVSNNCYSSAAGYLAWLLQTRSRIQPSYQSKHMFMKAIDQLPTGPEWHCQLVHVHGDDETHRTDQDPGNEGADRGSDEELELWLRDPVVCVQELLGNPAFRNELAYAPKKVYTDPQVQTHQYDKMWTGDWWWETQVGTWLAVCQLECTLNDALSPVCLWGPPLRP